MQLENPLTSLASALYSALHKDLPDIEYDSYDTSNWERNTPYSSLPKIRQTRRPHEGDVEIVMFPQTWGSTALGFGGVGGQAMTPAYTVIVHTHASYCVYFRGRFAYRIDNPNSKFLQDVHNQMMTDLQGAGKYERQVD